MSLPHLRDVSNWQHPIDWPVEAKEVVGCYVKVSQGIGYTDPWGRTHIENARTNRIPVGAYHFAVPGVGSGESQADRLLALAPRRPGDLRPCLDCEANPLKLNYGQLGAWYLAAVTRVVAKAGCYPTLYGSKDYLQNFAVFAPHVFGRCPLWIAAYIPHAVIPAPWHAWQAWQWTSTWRDNGIRGGVDDSLVSDLAALRIPRRFETVRVRRAARSLTPPPWSLKPLPQGPA